MRAEESAAVATVGESNVVVVVVVITNHSGSTTTTTRRVQIVAVAVADVAKRIKVAGCLCKQEPTRNLSERRNTEGTQF